VAEIRRSGQIIEESYEEDGIHLKAYVPGAIAGRLKNNEEEKKW
jgi:hypothetical protein